MTFTPGRPQEQAAGLDSPEGAVRVTLLHNPRASKPWRVETLEYRPAQTETISYGRARRPKPAGWYRVTWIEGYGEVRDRSFGKLGRAVRYRHQLLAALEENDIEGIADGDASGQRWERVR